MPARVVGKATDIAQAALIGAAATVATIVVVGQAQNTDTYRALERVPFVGPVLTGIKAIWHQVYNP